MSMSSALYLKVSFRGIFSLTGSSDLSACKLGRMIIINKLEISFLQLKCLSRLQNSHFASRSSKMQYNIIQPSTVIIFIAFPHLQIPVVVSPAKTRLESRIEELRTHFPEQPKTYSNSASLGGAVRQNSERLRNVLTLQHDLTPAAPRNPWSCESPIEFSAHTWQQRNKTWISRSMEAELASTTSLWLQEFSWPLHWAAEHSRCRCIITSHRSAASIAERSWNDLEKRKARYELQIFKNHQYCLYIFKNFHSTLHTPHFTLHTSHTGLQTSDSTLHTPHSPLSSPLHTSHFTLQTSHFTLSTLHSPLHTSHSTLLSWLPWSPTLAARNARLQLHNVTFCGTSQRHGERRNLERTTLHACHEVPCLPHEMHFRNFKTSRFVS